MQSNVQAFHSDHVPWPTPRPIRTELPKSPIFSTDLLPPALSAFVHDEAQGICCPPDYVGATLMVAMGSVIGARCGLRPKRSSDWLVVPNLWGAAVGEPSAKKTPAISAVMRWVENLEQDEVRQARQHKAVLEAETLAFEARYAFLKKELHSATAAGDAQKLMKIQSEIRTLTPPQEFLPRRFKSNDATIEKLGELLVKNTAGLLVFRDELVGLLSSWDSDGHEADRAFYLEAWNGTGRYSVDRIGRGSIQIESLCLSIFGGIQPDLLSRYLHDMSRRMDNDGRFQRFQVVVYPEAVEWQWRDEAADEKARMAVRDAFTRLATFDPLQDGAAPPTELRKVPSFQFDDVAQEAFKEWSIELHTRIASEANPLMKQHLAKFEKLFCSLALIMHLSEGQIGNVGRASLIRAERWCDFLEGHARRIYALGETASYASAALLSRRLQAGQLEGGFTVRDVWKKSWSGLSTAQDAARALGILEDFRWVVPTRDQGEPGRPTTRYWINPRIGELA